MWWWGDGGGKVGKRFGGHDHLEQLAQLITDEEPFICVHRERQQWKQHLERIVHRHTRVTLVHCNVQCRRGRVLNRTLVVLLSWLME